MGKIYERFRTKTTQVKPGRQVLVMPSDQYRGMIDDVENPNPDPEKKGKWGQNCNRTACQMPGATWYNIGTSKYYCQHCAHLINEGGTAPICFRGTGTEDDSDEIQQARIAAAFSSR